MKFTLSILLIGMLTASCRDSYPLPEQDDPAAGFRIGDKRYQWKERMAAYLENGQMRNNDPTLLSFKRTWNSSAGDIPISLHLNNGQFKDSPLFSITVTLPMDSAVVIPNGRSLPVTSYGTFRAVLRLLKQRYGEPEVKRVSSVENSYQWKNVGYTISAIPPQIWPELEVAFESTISYRSNRYKAELQDAERRKVIKDLEAVQP